MYRVVKILILFAGIFVILGALSCQDAHPSSPEPPVTNIADSNRDLIEEALEKFDPETRSYLTSLPIVYGNVRTALARTTTYEPPGREHIIVSYDWGNTYGESAYWESHFKKWGRNKNDPVFHRDTRIRLLIHEYLHHIEANAKIDIEKFAKETSDWYKDPQWGNPDTSSDGNYAKYLFFWYLYRKGDHTALSSPGREEFAHIGWQIATGGKTRLAELPPNIIEHYRGILREDLLVP